MRIKDHGLVTRVCVRHCGQYSISYFERGKHMDYSVTAKQLLEKLGGQSNIITVAHCMTRLRFVLKDEGMVSDQEVEAVPGVMGTAKKGGQYQVIIGNNVAKCYQEITKLGAFGEANAVEKRARQNLVSAVLDFISACMTPMISVIIAGGLLKVLLVIFGPTFLGLLSAESDTYIIINALGDSGFYFLPVFVAMSASKKLGCNMYLSVLVSVMLLYPDLITLLGGDAPIRLFGVIPVVHGNYTSSVIPAMLSAVVLKYVEEFVDRITPEWSKNFLKPLLIAAITGLVTLCVLAPLGLILGNGLQMVLNWIYNFAPWLAMALFAGFMPFIVMTGMHWAFTPTVLLALANPGYDLMLLPAMLCSNLAQSGAAFAVAFGTKDSKLKQIAFPAAISALLAGVTEPAMYGVTLKLKKPMYAACIASAIAGLATGIIRLKAYVFVTPCLTSIVQFVSPDSGMNFMFAIMIATGVFILSIVLTFILARKELAGTKETAIQKELPQEDGVMGEPSSEDRLLVETPVIGTVVPLGEVNDVTFSSEVLGKGYAVIPESGQVFAPFDGTVEVLMDTLHALGLVSDSGINLLIHVGLETVTLQGKYFTPHVQTGDRIKKGQLLLTFDLEQIRMEGYETVTPVIISNSSDYKIRIESVQKAERGTEILKLEHES